MKTYPSIPRSDRYSFTSFDAHIFDKLDGSNLRFEWSKKYAKKGHEHAWIKQGTRKRMFDETDPEFASAIGIFQRDWAEDLHNIARKQRWNSVVVFLEFWGPNSFAGLHDPKDEKKLTLFDVSPHQQGMLPPKEYLKLFGHLDIAEYLGYQKWNRRLVQEVYEGKFDSRVTFEGVIGKAKDGREVYMQKAKSHAWLEMVREMKEENRLSLEKELKEIEERANV